jgi:HEAT repeat protein
MLSRSVAARLDLPFDRLSRLALFVAMAVVQYAGNALARTAAEALFLANAGAEAIPYYLIAVGVTAVPAAAWMSRLIDRMPKARLFRISLVLAVVVAVALRGLVTTGSRPVWFAILIGIVLVEMLLNIQFWVLVADYFTSLEQKRMIAALTVSLAAGGTIGGGMANLLVKVIPTPDLLLVFPALYLVVFGLLLRLERTETPFEAAEGGGEESLGASLRSLPALLVEYPIIALMAIVGFLDVFLGAVGSFLSYTVYTQSFPDEQQMAEFLGILRAVMCVLQVVLVTFVTRPLISRLGIGRMNILYPMTSFASLVGIAARPILPVAVATGINFETVSSSLNNPVENLTYNAVPPRFLGRVRAISEGMLQPAGLTVGGLILAIVQRRWSFAEIAWFTVAVSALHVALGWWRGRKYVDALASQLSSRAVDLGSADGRRATLPEEYAEEVARLVESRESEAQAFGLELAARLGADRFLHVARPALERLEGRGREAGVTYLAALRSKEAHREVIELLETSPPDVQSLVLEATLRRRGEVENRRLEALFANPDPRVRGLARAAALRGEAGGGAPLLVRDPSLGDPGLGAVARGARAAEDRRLIPALVEAMVRGAPDTRATALEGLAVLAPLGEKFRAVLGLAELELESENPRVREAACALLGLEDRSRLALVAGALADSHARVRRRAAEVLGRVGAPAIPHLAEALRSSRPEVVEAALSALGAIRTEGAADAALAFLEGDYRQVERNERWRAQLPLGDARFAPLEAALADSNRRAVDQVLRVLEAFGHGKILRHARQALRGRDLRLRANAVEALASIPHRRFVLPVMDLLEALATETGREEAMRSGREGVLSFDELAASVDRWIRAGAAQVARGLGRPVPVELRADPDPVVRATAGNEYPPEDTPMSRLLFLKRVSLFQDLTLDDLLALDGALRRVDYLPGETIFEEGTIGDDFYVVSEGEVSVRTGKGAASVERARLGPGNFFGEMALFDDEARSATCVAATATTLLALDRGRFYSLIEQLPQLGVAICKTLTQRLRRTEMDLRAARGGAKSA